MFEINPKTNVPTVKKETTFTGEVFLFAKNNLKEGDFFVVPVDPDKDFHSVANRICARLQSKNKNGQYNLGFQVNIMKNSKDREIVIRRPKCRE